MRSRDIKCQFGCRKVRYRGTPRGEHAAFYSDVLQDPVV